MKLASVANPVVLEVFVDYGLVGFALEFPVPLTASERKHVQVGSTVLVTGDGVDDRTGEVLSIEEEPWVMIRLAEAHVR